MHFIFNESEKRARAGFRITLYLLISFFIVGYLNLLPLGGLQYILIMLVSIVFLGMMFKYFDKRSTLNIAGINLNKTWYKEFVIGVLIAAFAMGIIFSIQILTGTIDILGFAWHHASIRFWVYPLFLFFLHMVCVGFYEELIHRSYLLPNIKEGFTFKNINTRIATIIAVLLSSCVFGFVHGLNPHVTLLAILNIILAGVMFSIPFIFTGRVAYSMGMHFSWNFFEGGIFGFKVSGFSVHKSLIQIQQHGDPVWTGGTFGPEGGLIGTIGLLILTSVCLYCLKYFGVPLKIHPNFSKTYLEYEGKIKEKEYA